VIQMDTTVSYRSLSPEEVHALGAGGAVIDLVDVRTAGEFAHLHAQGARSAPLGTLTPQSVQEGRRRSPDQPLYIICQSGGRSRTACQRLAAAGMNVVNVEGGTSAWKRAGLPVVRSTSGTGGLPPAIRLAAVALAFVMIILGVTVHVAFLWAGVAVWFTLLLINRGCPLGSCATDPRSER